MSDQLYIFAQRLKALRIKRGFSQLELAKMAETDNMSIGHYERGRREPRLTVLYRLADALDVSLDFLVGRKWRGGNG